MTKLKYHSTTRDYFLESVKTFTKPFTAKDLIDYVSKNTDAKISTSTIYRLLDEYVNSNELHRSYTEDNIAKYYYFQKCDNSNHFYLECSKCHSIFHLDCKHLKSFAKHISKKHNFTISSYQLIIDGLCEKCQQEQNETKA